MAVDWRELVRLVTPAVGQIAARGYNANFMAGFQRAQARHDEERRRLEEDGRRKKEASARYAFDALTKLQSITDPAEFAQWRDAYASHADVFGADANEITNIPFSQTRASMDAIKKLNTALEKLVKMGYDLPTLAQDPRNTVTPDGGGKAVPIASALEIANFFPHDAQGKAIAAPKKEKDTTSFQHGTVLYQGKEVLAGYNPKTNQWVDDEGNVLRGAQPVPRRQGSGGGGSADAGINIEAIADAIIAGEQPPTLTGMYGKGAAVRSMLAKKGFNLAQASSDWAATQRRLASLNGTQQTRLIQAVDTASHSLDVIEDLAKQWQAGRFPLLNRAKLAAAKQGALGPQAQQIATQLEAQISDVTSELANVYMGGNSPTDHAMELAAKNLSADWDQGQLLSALTLARKNLQIRSNSMRNTPIAGASPENPYAPPAGAVGEWDWERDPKTGKLTRKVTR